MNKKQILILLLMAALASCANQPLYLVNAFGDRDSCTPSARDGIIGNILPNKVSEECKTALTQIGYLPEEEAGTVNIIPEMRDGYIIAASLPDDALQQQPDLENGDQILAIDGQKPTTTSAVQSMLFGAVNSTVTIIFSRDNIELPVKLIRHPIHDSTTMPEVIPLATDTYISQATPPPTTKIEALAPASEKATTSNGATLFQHIKQLFSSLTHPPIQPSDSENATAPSDPYSQTAPPAQAEADISNISSDSYTAPSAITPLFPPPPLIIVGDQVCRARQHFIDVGTVADQRGERILVAIDHIQLIRAPYTEFHHFGEERTWSRINSWQPCSGDAPLFLHPQ
ncbi:MAG: hypothetical protein R8J85_07665 [Mariprofundales bacterium]